MHTSKTIHLTYEMILFIYQLKFINAITIYTFEMCIFVTFRNLISNSMPQIPERLRKH